MRVDVTPAFCMRVYMFAFCVLSAIEPEPAAGA
jgi:hypothetical protein